MPSTPPDLRLYRVGLRPDPLAWTPWRWVGGGRYDDPLRLFRVLYAAEARLTCLKEVFIAQRRRTAHESKLAAALADLDDDRPLPTDAADHRIMRAWRLTHAYGELLLAPRQPYLDLRDTADLLAVERELGQQLGIDDITLAHIASAGHDRTQIIARWAFEIGYHAIRYPSRIGADDKCWAIFDVAQFTPLAISAIAVDDPDLRQVADMYGLTIERGEGD